MKQTPGAATLLNLCCFLAPEEIPLDLIVAGMVGARRAVPLPEELVALADSKLKMNKAIAALRRYSLITREDDTLSLHRLVQTVARDQMPPPTAQSWLEATVKLLEKLWPFDQYDMASWVDSARLLPHLLAVIAAAELHDLETLEAATLNGFADFYFSYKGNFAEARPYSLKALAIAEKNSDQDHFEIAIHLNNLGTHLQDLGEYEAARPYLERALEISENALGPDHPSVAIRLNNLGLLLQDLGDYQAAQPCLERALAIFENALGPDHLNTQIVRENLELLIADIERNK